MLPEVSFGSFSISSNLIFWGIGIILCLSENIAVHKLFKLKWYSALFLGLIMILLEIFGAKIMFLIENPSEFSDAISWSSGYSLYGVFYFTPIFILLLSKFIKMKFLPLMDFLSPGILIELAFYRIGCMCVGCCYGIDVGWGISNGIQTGLFPVQPIEAILDLIIFAVIICLFLKKKLKTGETFISVFFSYSFIRFFLEFVRHRTNIIGPFSVSHILAFLQILLCIAGFFLLRYFNKKQARELKP